MAQVVLGGERPPIDSHVAFYWPVRLQETIRRCWSSNPSVRPSFLELKEILSQIIDSYALSSPAASEKAIKPAAGGFASLKPAKIDRSRGNTVGGTPTSSKAAERRHWSFGIVRRHHD